MAGQFLDECHLNPALMIFLEWLSENGGYYFTAWLCDKFAPEDDKVFEHGSESVKQLIIVEGLDCAVRWFLLWLGPCLLPSHKALGAGIGSMVADISFTVTLTKSHCLVEICSHGLTSVGDILSHRPLPLRLSLTAA